MFNYIRKIASALVGGVKKAPAVVKALTTDLPTTLRNIKKDLKDEPASQAVRIKTLEEIDPSLIRPKHTPAPAEPTNIMLRMKDGRPMRYFTDGSLRHAMPGGKPSWKVIKKARRAVLASTRKPVAA